MFATEQVVCTLPNSVSLGNRDKLAHRLDRNMTSDPRISLDLLRRVK